MIYLISTGVCQDAPHTQLLTMVGYINEFTESSEENCSLGINNVNENLLQACATVKNKLESADYSHKTVCSDTTNQHNKNSSRGISEKLKIGDESEQHVWVQQVNNNVRFSDVIGCLDAKQAFKEAVFFPLRYPILLRKLKATPWHSLLLYGPPGTGKSLLARYVFGYLNVS
jgi:ATP-dependent 26S proteasome regulatory subunit